MTSTITMTSTDVFQEARLVKMTSELINRASAGKGRTGMQAASKFSPRVVT